MSRPLPSDELVPNPTFNATRAITIAARPEQVWPWLLQMGETTWAWQLEETGNGSTRLLTRVRSHYPWWSPSIAFSALLEFGDI